MIFKWLTFEKDKDGKGYHDVWHFIDNVKDASVYWDKDLERVCALLVFSDEKLSAVYAVYNTGYLLSDSGKTIERLRVPDGVKLKRDKPNKEYAE